MTMRFNLRHWTAALVAVVVLLLGGVASAQTALTQTTLSAAITDTVGSFVNVTSATGFTANTTGFLIDREYFTVRSVSGTVVTASRGQSGTRAATHVNGATVTVGAPAAFQGYAPSGQCTRTNLLYVPAVVVSSGRSYDETGDMYDCLGVTSAGQWVKTNGPSQPVLGTTVASATTIALTGTYTKVSGTTAIATITAPAGLAAGYSITLEPTAIWTTTTAGNIILASTAVVGKQLIMTWNGTKWVPSY